MYRASDTLDQHAIEQIRVELRPRGEFDESDNQRERVGLVRRFGLDLTNQAPQPPGSASPRGPFYGPFTIAANSEGW